MKKVYTLVFLCFINCVLAQIAGKIEVNWGNLGSCFYGENSRIIPHFDDLNFVYNYQLNTLQYSSISKTTGFIDEDSLEINSLVTQNITDTELGELDKTKIPTTILAQLTNVLAREIISTQLQFYPIIKTSNGYQKIISFNYSAKQSSISSKNNNINAAPNAITNSVLGSGIWYRFYVEKSGVYALNKSFLKSIGFDVNGIDPQKIKVYGNGGHMLPILNSAYYPDDLTENAIEVVGETDGVFNDNDYILMYAEGMDNWDDDNYTHGNLYADKSYYYVTFDNNNGKRIQTENQPTAAASIITTTYDQYNFHEVDKTNLNHLGRVWYGEDFSIENEQEFTFDIPNIAPTTTANITIHVGDVSFTNTKFKTSINNNSEPDINLTHVTSDIDEVVQNTLYTSAAANTTYTIKLTYDNNGVPTSKGYLDFIKLKTTNNLTGFGKQFRFEKYNTGTGIIEYQFSNASSITKIWNITDIYNTTAIVNNNNNQSNFLFKDNLTSTIKKYIAIDTNNIYEPLKDTSSAIANQDLHGTVFLDNNGFFQDIDYLIITPNWLSSPANKLADFHRNNSGMNVKVVTLENIYQEFGGGKQDVGAIRNFIKYVYQNASSVAKKVKYVNLFGDASFDYKNRIRNNTNIVPIFNGLDIYASGDSTAFATDDFFGMVDNTDASPETNLNGIDIALGRMLVSSEQQANEMVNKVIEYHDIKSYGSWRNNYVCIADDPDSFKTGDRELQYYQNRLTDIIYAQKPFLNYKKILLDLYQQETTAGGDRYPKAKADIQNSFEKGALVFNYLGHGGETGLTQERVWDKFDGSNFLNQYKYPLFITLTCTFSRFDNPLNPTAGEYTYWNPKGGAIALITTVRTIGQGGAQSFNDILSSYLFSYGSNNYYSIAESLRQAKNSFVSTGDKRIISYLGDPALTLAFAKQKIVLTKVNDVPITQTIDDLKALNYVKLSGEVQDELGNSLSSYNGELFVTVFDKNYIKYTLRNDGVDAYINQNGGTAPYLPVNTLGETIFRGNASVINGQFEFGFVVPKDIKIPVDNGRISFYAKRNQLFLDKTGYNLDIKIGGINLNAVADTTAPTAQLYMNDESFVNGGITNQSPYLLVNIQDEHGINTASGIGHDLVAILDGDENNPYILNDYYETELNNYTHGKIRYPFRNLAVGLHTIIFKGWDVYNNLITLEIQFIVTGDNDLALTNVLNYPNPFINYTQFWFSHNKPYENLDVQVQIFTITGKIVKTINQTITTEGFLSRSISWDGLDDFGDKIGKGVYVYKLTVKSSTTGKKSEKTEKLVIL